jgi:hypothetical protein
LQWDRAGSRASEIGGHDSEASGRDRREYAPALATTTWPLHGGGYVGLGQLESHADYGKYQGRRFALLLIDEAGQYAQPDLLDLTRSKLRGAKDMPIRVVVAANPGGPRTSLVSKALRLQVRTVEAVRGGQVDTQMGLRASSFAGNDRIDREQYRDELESACPEDRKTPNCCTPGEG